MSSTANSVPSPPAAKPYLTIRPSTHWSALNLPEVWQFRDLLMTLAARDVKLRYRQTALGVIWVVLQPLMAAAVYVFVFYKLAGLSTGRIPAVPFIFSGLLAWNAFSGTLTKTSGSLVGNAHLVSKVFFPRLVLPLSSVFGTLIDFGVSFVILAVMMAVCHIAPGWSLLLLPVWLLVMQLLALGVGLVTAALTVQYRDVGFVLPVVTQYLQFASPVLYATFQVTTHLGRWSSLYYLNPLASLLEAFRWSLFGLRAGGVHWAYLAYAVVFSLLVLVGGAFQFKKMERKFADVI